jgi:uncharacterized GH25 family protein
MLEEETIYRVREEITTDDESNFVLHNASPEAAYHIWWGPDDTVNRDFDYGRADIDISQIPENKSFTVEVKRYIETMMGTVVDRDGNPVKGAAVQIDDWSMLPQDARGFGRGFATNEKGEFEIARLAKGKVELTVRHDDFKGVRLAGVPTDSINVKAVLMPKGDISVTAKISDSEGKPMPGARIILFGRQIDPLDPMNPKEIQTEALTDEKGLCVFQKLEQDKENTIMWVLMCDVPGCNYEFRQLERDLDSHLEITVTKIGEGLRGTVFDADGAPLARAKVVALGVGYESGEGRTSMCYGIPEELFTAHTDENGAFSFARLSQSQPVILNVSAEGYAKKQYEGWRPEERKDDIAITLLPGCALSGRVIYEDAKQGAEKVLVYARNVDNPRTGGNATTDSEGAFSIEELEPGTYEIVVRLPGDAPEWTAEPLEKVEVAARQMLKEQNIVLIKGCIISGTVTDAATHTPVEKGYVYARVKDNPRSGIGASARTDAEGHYALRLPPGRTYTVTAVQIGGPPQNRASKEIVVEKGENYDKIDFSVNP